MTLPEQEVLRLKQAVTGRSGTELILHPELSVDEKRRFDEFAARRVAGEPLQYLEGTVAFGPIELRVDPRALIPRPETEQLFELACGLVEEPGVIVDLCTGSGNLALALQHTFPDAEVYATDISAAAVSLAQENATALGLDIEVLEGDIFAPLPPGLRGTVDLLVANPPYVADGDPLPAVVVDHEPAAALFAGRDGLAVIRRIADEAGEWLAPGGVVVCEIGATQGVFATHLFASLGGHVERDLADRDRFVVGVQARSNE